MSRFRPGRGVGVPGTSLAALLITLAAAAQNSKAPEATPAELVRITVNNEISGGRDSIKHMFRSRKQTPKGSQTHLYVETNQAMVGLLIEVNDRQISPEQKQAELNHLSWLESDPDALSKKRANEKQDAERTMRIMRALPDAFNYRYDGTQPGSAASGGEGKQLVRLRFTPNPSYSPPSHVEQVLTGMEGTLLIDPEAHRIARIDGTLFKGVSFGWGIFGHLDKGSTFRVDQADIGDGAWDLTEMKLDITGKILLIKSLSMISDETFSDFQRVPDNLSFSNGVQLLKAQEEKLSGSGSADQAKRTPQ